MLWNAGATIANHISLNPSLIRDKYVLEFGAGAALPSLVAALCGAKKVVATDYPDPALIENIDFNIQNCSSELRQGRVVAEVRHVYYFLATHVGVYVHEYIRDSSGAPLPPTYSLTYHQTTKASTS